MYIKDCKYVLGWDMSYKNCHRGIYPFAAPQMYLGHQKESKAYQNRLGRATTTYIGDIETGEGRPHSAPGYYRRLLQTLSSYIKLLTTVVGKKRVHLREVVVIRKSLRTRMDIYVDIEKKMIIYLLWAIFLDTGYLFSKEVQLGKAL